MNLENIIRLRRSTYPNQFSGEDITAEELERILAVSAYAPNHKKTKPWRYIVFTGESKHQLAQKIAMLYQQTTHPEKFLEIKQQSIKEKVENSAAIICIVHNISQAVPEWEEHAAIAMSVQNMWLKATEMGIGGYWSTMSIIRNLDEYLELDENQNCIGMFFLGKISGSSEPRNYDWKEFVTFRA